MQKALDTLILLEKLKNNKGVYEEIGPEVEGLETESLLALAELKELLNNLES